MDSCLKLIPRNCYNTYSSVVLALFVAIGVVLVAIASDNESKSSLECDLTSSLFKGKYIETQCRLQYAQEFLPSLSLNVQIVISFGLVVVCSVVYGYLVKHRVDMFTNNPNTTTNEGVEESQPLSEASPATPVAYQVTLVEIVYLLWSAWKRPTFHTDQEFINVYLLRKRTKTILEITNLIREGQSNNLFNVSQGFRRKRNLDEIYINVIIQDGRDSRSEFMKKGRHEIYDIQLEKPPSSKVLESTAELFQAAEAGEDHPRTVLVVGRPGIGKTLLTEKIFHEWLRDKRTEFWHEKIVLLILFRNFNKGETSLQDMLHQAHGLGKSISLPESNSMSIYEYVCQKPSNAVLVFDGLDELQVDDKCLTDGKIINNPKELAHIYLIFKQLVKGKLLPGATVLTTSRPTAEHIYQNLDFKREVEILGFSEKQIEEYVGKFCYDDTQKSSEIWNIIKNSPELLSFCYVPVNSSIVCLTLHESLYFGEHATDGNYSRIPRTITELYKRAIKILLFKHNSKYRHKEPRKNYLTAKLPEQLRKDLDKLKEIAREGMGNDQLVFEFDGSDEFITDLANSGVFNQLEDENRYIFSFLHLTIQEFLAALHVVDDIKNVERFLEDHINEPRWHLVIQFVAGLLGDKMRELRSAEHENSEVIDEPRWHFVNRFVAGLLGDKMRELRSAKHDDSEVIERICKRFQDWMPKKRRIDWSNDKSLLVIKSVWEMQEDRVMKMISSFASEDDDSFASEDDDLFASEDDHERFTLFGLNIAPAESTALFKFLSHIKNLKQLKINGCTVTNITIRELAEFLKKDKHGLENDNCELTELDVSNNTGLTTEGVKYLSDALKSDNCKLTKLYVSANDLKTEGVKYLSDALKSDNCKLTKLYVSANDLETKGAKYLSDALKSDNCKLTKLNVSGKQTNKLAKIK
ncbi:NACHT, LRR and PYD domains-containing protein 3-like [Dendronephthya gigantea]|uniref:NACHT, LRR and PYD domains-containing protein 3-like n=1 Tax=Dendronephthya gigantea TaxID=151771 RepID=UPI00106CA331|nr:NACHT, LRR and PYD domains-containing protein 3-like [Dendronephthya gigantea]